MKESNRMTKNEEWKKANTDRVVVKLFHSTDADIIEHLANIPEGKMTYIKRLIREDIARQK